MTTTTGTPARTTPGAAPRGVVLRDLLLGRDAGILVLLVAVWLLASAVVPKFSTPNTVYFLLLDVFPILLIALPMTLVIITSEIDLSVGSMVGLSSVVVGALYDAGWSIPAAAATAVAVGVLGGALNGFLVTRLGLPSLAVTIGALALFRGIAVGLLGTRAITGFPDGPKDLVSDRLLGKGTALPGIVLLFVALAVVFVVVLHLTPTGRSLYVIGLNEEVARFSGIAVGRTKFWLFVVTGAVAALAGVYWTLRYDSARGDNAAGLELSVVAAVLVGGVSIFGGRGSLVGVIAGALTIGALRSALRLADVSADVINVATGLLLVVTVVVPSVVAALRRAVRPSPRKEER